MSVINMSDRRKPKPEPSLQEAKNRIKEKAREIKKKNIVPPVDESEPLGPLSGGPEHLDLPDNEKPGK